MAEETPEELLAKGVAPIKRAHWKPAEPEQQPEQPAPQRAQAKSKKQQKRERSEQKSRGKGVCHAHLQNSCPYGDACRFSHNAADFLAGAAANLPGPCPLQDACTAGAWPCAVPPDLDQASHTFLCALQASPAAGRSHMHTATRSRPPCWQSTCRHACPACHLPRTALLSCRCASAAAGCCGQAARAQPALCAG